jgi:uncharacterized protein
MDQDLIHNKLLNPFFYPEKTAGVEYRETHISRVYLLDDYVYKMKKPVNLGFLDFSSLESRRFFCEEEVSLNSRFCPDTYLGVVPVCLYKGDIHIGPPGEEIEYVVKMRRLPEDMMLNVRLGEPAGVGQPEMVRLARHIAASHLALPSCNHDEGYSDLMHVRRNWNENFRQTEAFIGSAISPGGFEALGNYVAGFLEDHDGLIDQRERDGWVRECHGDLHAEHICLTEPVRIYDCIEFNRRFRISDILADMAFLLMDLDRNGRPDLSAALWQAYRERLNSPVSGELVVFYKVYRAFVRAKVAAIASSQKETPADVRQAARNRALGYFNLALGYLPHPSLLITCGLMGTGKSRIAASLASALRAEWIRSDVIRLGFKKSADEGREAGFLSGPYRKETTEEVYKIMARQARERLAEGKTVILDAAFGDESQRRRMQELASELKITFTILNCVCPRDIALERLRSRHEEGKDASDGRVELYDIQKEHFQTPSQDEPVIEVDTSGAVEYAANIILGKLSGVAG